MYSIGSTAALSRDWAAGFIEVSIVYTFMFTRL